MPKGGGKVNHSQSIKNEIEGQLFVSKKPLAIERISKLVGETEQVVGRLVDELRKDYETRGIRIRRVAGGFEMVSAHEYYETIAPVAEQTPAPLSPSALETVTVVAYHELLQGTAASKEEIQQKRGVKDPEHGIQRALELKLIKEKDSGYVTTDDFLIRFGINDLKELPALEEETKGTNDIEE